MPRRTAATKPSNELNRQERRLLTSSERAIAKGLDHFIAVGAALAEIQEKRLYRQSHDTFEAYLAERWDMARATGNRRIQAARVASELASPNGDIPAPTREAHVRPLLTEPRSVRESAWRRAVEEAGSDGKVTGALVKRCLDEAKREMAAGVDEPEQQDVLDPPAPEPGRAGAFERKHVQIHAPAQEREFLVAVPNGLVGHRLKSHAQEIGLKTVSYEKGVPARLFGGKPPIDEILDAYRSTDRSFKFNPANEQIDWASYTWNPVTGCLHTCPYCYARYLGEKRYSQGFSPTFHTGRLLAPEHQPLPAGGKPPAPDEHVRERNVFTCSMADLYGRWVPEWAIEAVHDAVERAPRWRFLMLTKFPQKLAQFEFPGNAWIGTTVDKQASVDQAEKYFADVKASVKWLSCEPMLERLTFTSLGMFDCVVIGAQEGYAGGVESKQPEFEWVLHLMRQALASGTKIYWKANLDVPKQLPTMPRFKPDLVDARLGAPQPLPAGGDGVSLKGDVAVFTWP